MSRYSVNMTCQNCQQNFTVYEEDKNFYARLNVPEPTFCPECRMIRRMAIRNEHALYARKCGLCQKNIISMYAPAAPFIVYCVDCWNSDKWDPMSYGLDYNFERPFFEQFREFMEKVPRISLYQHINEKSDYTNYSVYLKNSYLVFGGHHYEDCLYNANSIYLKDCVDVEFCRNSEKCYGSVHLNQCYNVRFSQQSENCADSWFLFDCRNCDNCVGCSGLRNKSYHIYNTPYTSDEYQKKLAELNLGSYSSLRKAASKAAELAIQLPRRFAMIKNVENSTGDDLENVKNCFYCFSSSGDEDCRYSFFLPGGAKDVYDADHVGLGVELAYELMSGFENNRVAFGNRIYNCHDVFYSDDCHSSSELLGCIGLRKKNFCIFNKQYTPEEYAKLRVKIIEQMNAVPFHGKNGRVYKFGEFFPIEISTFAYNETMAHDYFPLAKGEALAKGYHWRDATEKHPSITLSAANLPDDIKNVDDKITSEVIACEHDGNCNHQCARAFKIITRELKFYRASGLPLPRICPNCRHYERLAGKNPLHLWPRQCDCAQAGHQWHEKSKCSNSFDTSYPPETKSPVFCEKCYQTVG